MNPTALGQRLIGTIVVGAIASLSACGINNDDAPRNIPYTDRMQLGVGNDNLGGAATGTARIFLVAPDVVGSTPAIVPVPRDVDDSPAAVLAALFAGPNSDEADQQYRTALPTRLRLLATEQRGGTLVVDVSTELRQLSGTQLVAALAQIVFTSSELIGVRSVSILVNGAEQQWPTGNGEERRGALTTYDYPGLQRSGQPAYPAIPSPAADTTSP